ncbi:MAG: hypothetical protein Q9200_001082 [Gallowayella weberi]
MDQECQKLRTELKDWEKSFAATNGGKKAGREDIKRHPEIAAKYKIYNKLRAQASDSLERDVAPTPDHAAPRKRHASNHPPASAHTPQKRSKHLHSSHEHAEISQDQAPGSAQKTPVAHRISIGPTPQRNGRVLGLFDLLTPSSSFRTPSKRQSLAPLPPNVVGTPSKVESKLNDDGRPTLPCSSGMRRRSPPGASKTTYQASFLTPSTRRIADVGNTPVAANSVSNLRFDDTPAFLRRHSQNFLQSQKIGGGGNQDEEDASSWSPVAIRVMRPKPAGRGLSALVKGLRDMEEAKLDDELEMLREMEGGGGVDQESQVKHIPQVCVGDSQAPDMPLGADGEGQSESEDMEALEMEGKDRSGRPLKIWKKKGQKRTTRRVTMRPNTAKWKPEPEWKGGKEQESEEEVIAVKETQLATPAQAAHLEDDADDLQMDEEYVGVDASDEDPPRSHASAKTAKAKQAGKPKDIRTEPPQKKKKKVVNAAAHTNYRALKIRNKNSKGKGSGRFVRRR